MTSAAHDGGHLTGPRGDHRPHGGRLSRLLCRGLLPAALSVHQARGPTHHIHPRQLGQGGASRACHAPAWLHARARLLLLPLAGIALVARPGCHRTHRLGWQQTRAGRAGECATVVPRSSLAHAQDGGSFQGGGCGQEGGRGGARPSTVLDRTQPRLSVLQEHGVVPRLLHPLLLPFRRLVYPHVVHPRRLRTQPPPPAAEGGTPGELIDMKNTRLRSHAVVDREPSPFGIGLGCTAARRRRLDGPPPLAPAFSFCGSAAAAARPAIPSTRTTLSHSSLTRTSVRRAHYITGGRDHFPAAAGAAGAAAAATSGSDGSGADGGASPTAAQRTAAAPSIVGVGELFLAYFSHPNTNTAHVAIRYDRKSTRVRCALLVYVPTAPPT